MRHAQAALSSALAGLSLRRVGVPDQFIEHGKAKELRALAGVDKAGIKKALLELLGRAE